MRRWDRLATCGWLAGGEECVSGRMGGVQHGVQHGVVNVKSALYTAFHLSGVVRVFVGGSEQCGV